MTKRDDGGDDDDGDDVDVGGGEEGASSSRCGEVGGMESSCSFYFRYGTHYRAARSRETQAPHATPAVGITRALNGCNHAGLPVDGRLARLLVRDHVISVRILCCG